MTSYYHVEATNTCIFASMRSLWLLHILLAYSFLVHQHLLVWSNSYISFRTTIFFSSNQPYILMVKSLTLESRSFSLIDNFTMCVTVNCIHQVLTFKPWFQTWSRILCCSTHNTQEVGSDRTWSRTLFCSSMRWKSAKDFISRPWIWTPRCLLRLSIFLLTHREIAASSPTHSWDLA